MRHCQASPDSPTNSDFDRPLTSHGLKQAELVGDQIASFMLDLEAIYLSPSKRTMQTAKGVMEQLSYQPRLMDAEEIYEATENVLKAVVQRFDPNFDFVALLGHNPSISMLCNYLSNDPRSFTPGSMACIRFEVEDWKSIGQNSGSLVDFFQP